MPVLYFVHYVCTCCCPRPTMQPMGAVRDLACPVPHEACDKRKLSMNFRLGRFWSIVRVCPAGSSRLRRSRRRQRQTSVCNRTKYKNTQHSKLQTASRRAAPAISPRLSRQGSMGFPTPIPRVQQG